MENKTEQISDRDLMRIIIQQNLDKQIQEDAKQVKTNISKEQQAKADKVLFWVKRGVVGFLLLIGAWAILKTMGIF